ncbi:putative integral membrane protein [Arthrobacter sp. PvP102]|uniref:LapA family protein n=1 Tax=unclassified Arthrobacter TaxID=235627 RepID=UPI001AE66012|nr:MULTISPECIES: lipopolysaccharide assembly protein LapA domain-containing protein [unclassified Arthrobacter]MBP1231724.1 putative integral membrane protein [Arthrobacter sp. PvP103]MBP1236859.1 putative integral membrane protein [Arthrobacter sp. PvP102]
MTQQSPDYEPQETTTSSAQTGPGAAQSTPPAGEPAPGVPAQGAPAPGSAGQGAPGEVAPGEVAPARRVPAPGAPATQATAPPEDRHVTRAGMVWVAVATALAVMVLLIIFILQNQDYVQVRYFGLEGAVPLGIALFIAAVGGGVLVAVAGAARIIQLRAAAHRRRVLAQRVR